MNSTVFSFLDSELSLYMAPSPRGTPLTTDQYQINTAAVGMEDQVADTCKAGELQSGAGDGKSFIVRIMVQIEFHAVFLLGGYFGIWTSFSSHSPNGSSKRFIWLVM